MKFFLDTASLDEIKYWKKLDLVNGVTTNPVLLEKEKTDSVILLKHICKIISGPVSAQVTETKSEKMIKQGYNLSKIAKNIIIKLPCNHDGLKAAKILKKKNIKINVTLGFNPAQLTAFANLNVDYFSLILGKTEDWGFSNVEAIANCKKIIQNMKSNTKLLVASIRNEDHLIRAITDGADIVTVPPSTWKNLYKNKYTDMGLDTFYSSWRKVNNKFKKNYES